MIVPGGGISADGSRWNSSSEDYLLPVSVLSRLFRGKMLAMLKAAHEAGRLQFFGDHAGFADRAAFKAWLEPLYATKWHVHAKRPFAGPQQVLAYLARYTHRVAISNSRLIGADETGVTFRYKDYRVDGPDRYKTMMLAPAEFIRRFMLHVLPKGFHRIRHYGLLASGPAKAARIERARELIAAVPVQDVHKQAASDDAATAADKPEHPCPRCGGRMVIIETFEAGTTPRQRSSAPTAPAGIDTS
jgi:hypothetical protein